jgi:MHS family proline/betaine transporter-like MFS transporter
MGVAGVPAHDAEVAPGVLRKVLTASFIGNFVEWFDYASYGYFATVIAHAFFPEIAPTAALMATFAVFAISFVIRPIGGIIWGSIGDKIGRRTALSWSILIMSGATTVIALLPSYAQIGILAPILLLVVRMVQGFSASGEYAGATSFIAEYSPTAKRGFYTSMVPASTAAGLLAGSLMSAALFGILTEPQMQSFGWRLPFLLAFPLGLIGLYIRLRLEDTEVPRA